MNPLKAFAATLGVQNQSQAPLKVDSVFDITINDIRNNPLNLRDFKGKYILFVNVASKCGFTPQYKALQSLYDKYKDKLEIIAVPCNQFGGQEPGDATSIESFCEMNYGVNFPITEKIQVKGKNQHPLYAWLTQKVNNGKKDTSVKWNFQKYLIDPNGNLVDYFLSTTNPMSTKITKLLN